MEIPLSEQYRIVAKKWVNLDDAARLLEDTKSAVFAQMVTELGDMPVNAAERDVRASREWRDHVVKIVKARTEANLAKVQLAYIKMKHMEQSSKEANARAEMKLF